MAWMGAAIAAGGALLANERRSQSAESLTGEQQAWQERMRSSAYPATVQSMKDAGLNPMLAYQQGALPVGNYTPIQPIIENVGGAAMQGYEQTSTAQKAQQETASIAQEMTSFEKRMEKLNWEAKKAGFDSYISQYQAGIKSAEEQQALRYYIAEAKKLEHEAQLRGLEVPKAIKEAAMWNTEFGTALPYAREGAAVGGDILKGLNPFRRR